MKLLAGRPAIPPVIRQCPRAKEHMDWLYSYYARDGELLYIGVAIDPAERANNHRQASKWWRFVNAAAVEAVPLSQSGECERDFIYLFTPLFNGMYRTYGYDEVIEFCARRQAWDLVDDYADLTSYGEDESAQLACAALNRRFPYRQHMADWEIVTAA